MEEIKKAQKRGKKIALLLKKESDSPLYLKEVLRTLRKEINIVTPRKERPILYIPTEEEISLYYETVWQAQNMMHVILLKTLLYTGVRVSELVNIEIDHIDFKKLQIEIPSKKNKNPRSVPFPHNFREILALYANSMREKGATYLFESSRKKHYTERGIRKILAIYTKKAGIKGKISPQRLRHFLFSWMKKQGIESAFIQTYSGHKRSESLALYDKLSIDEAQKSYNTVIGKFPI